MENKIRVLPPDVLMEPLLGLVQEGNEVPLVISGNSMSPFLVHGRDTVYLSKLKDKPKKGDIILYRRDSGDYILHRVCKVKGESYSFVGDAQSYIETGIRPDQLLAVVKTVKRKGKIITSGNFWWEFFEKVWINMIPLRRFTVGAYTRLKH
ncbi:MAG: S24/S26 family peptidase [Oscillospiraceae bacterium]|nr:S24/S26 family peptidase [Oscillospiraceae bacterium]